MIDASIINLDALRRWYLFANIPGYLFRHFRSDDSVRALGRAYGANDLIQEVVRVDSLGVSSVDETTLAYAALVALSFRNADEVAAALPGLGNVRNIRWLDELLAYVTETERAVSTGVLRAGPRIVAPEEQRAGTEIAPTVYLAGERR
jgi:hypothetical protein